MFEQNEEYLVPKHLIERFADKPSVGTLNMHDPTRSTAEIIVWRQKTWVCTGYISSAEKGVHVLDLREVLPLAMWGDKPFNDLDKRGLEYYTGGRFHPKGKPAETWVVTERKIKLRPDPKAAPLPVQERLV